MAAADKRISIRITIALKVTSKLTLGFAAKAKALVTHMVPLLFLVVQSFKGRSAGELPGTTIMEVDQTGESM